MINVGIMNDYRRATQCVCTPFFYDRARLFYYLANGFQTFDLFVLYL